MNINIRSKDINLTPEIKDYVNEKIGSLTKFFDNIIEANIEVGRQNKHHKKGDDLFFANVNLKVPNKTLRVEETEPRLKKAIDKAKDDLQRELKGYKRKIGGAEQESIKMIEPEDLDLGFPPREEEES